ncbi:hypothetical protein ASC94_11075 [Massilia sp. Root418]|uniref:OmpA family protein n=1 Tax=Massilia sp. Root418 TaxID=1736532 RepID=UPI0006F9D8FD|nr:OmpA family protein [Massilia sp. Root418]KQW93209.1 hypothetical protein ASC94_11075 [Massilia sp. Root418]
MMRRIMLVSALIAAATSGPMLLAGCAGAVTYPTTMPARVEHSATRNRIAQLGQSQGSYFALCLDPACPSVTLKTPSESTGPTAHAGTEAATSFTGTPAAVPDTLVIQFPSGSAAFGPGEARALSHLSGVMREAGRIAIAGRTDSTGSDAINHRLAWSRARVVADHLRDQLGVAPGRLSWEGRGACCYVGDNRTSIGRQANRRAEVMWHPAPEARP